MVLTKTRVSRRAKLGLVAAAAAVSSLAGAGLAGAAPAHIPHPETGQASYLVGHAPDGTRITGHSWADGRGPAAASAAEAPVKVTGSITLAANDLLTKRGGHGAQPPAAGPTRGEMSVAGGYQWFPGRVGSASGVRIRASIPYGTVLGQLPRYGYVWLWCEARASNGTWWYWTAYNTGSRWIYGYASAQYLYPSPDRAIPSC